MNETMNIGDLGDMVLFVHIAQEGSISAAGRKLGLPKATLSRRLAALEARMGVSLVRRSTRSLTLTDAGQRYFERILPIVRDASEVQAQMAAESGKPSGLVRISAPTAYGHIVAAPKLFGFLVEHTALRIDLVLSDERSAVIAERFDLAIRMGVLEDSELVAQKIDTVQMRLVASRKYLSAFGEPKSAAELSSHRAILTRRDLDRWHIGQAVVRPQWTLSTGNMELTCDAALAGVGIALVPAFLADDHVRAGRLVRLLPRHPMAPVDVHVLTAQGVSRAPAVRALIRCLRSQAGPTSRSRIA